MINEGGGFVLGEASAADIVDIVALLQANEASRGGSITGHFDRDMVAAFLADMPVIIARQDDRLAGVLVSSSVAAVGHIPVIAAMLRTYRGGADTYIYGPICIDARDRGRGLAEKLFSSLKTVLPAREGILFIRADNAASIRAHQEKLGMTPRGRFVLDGVEYMVLSYRG
jgi:Acetyltransferase (GNAT) family